MTDLKSGQEKSLDEEQQSMTGELLFPFSNLFFILKISVVSQTRCPAVVAGSK
jgi:hypothetical protein